MNRATASIRDRVPSATRYAGATLVGAVRERYRSTGVVIPADHRTHQLVRLVCARNLRALDLRTEKNLDVLRVDDQISTGQHPDVWATCHRLVDAVRRWWTGLDAIVYRSRTTPESSLNYAFFGDDGFDVESWPLGERGRRSGPLSSCTRASHRQLGFRRRLVACTVSHRRSNVDVAMARLETRVATDR